ncbi:MAG: hypothetical protein K2Z80_26410 [Xanthobacteraceae bacterium]|nr:hypothetical protein [Xanthobacteraceae bacterium]
MQRFRFNHLATEERMVARRVYFGVLALYCSATLILGAALKLSAPTSGNAMPAGHWGGLFSAVAAERPDLAACAARDLKVLTALGEHGEAQDVPGDIIAAAFFSLVKARAACAAENFTEALAIYDGISLVPGRSAKK